MDSHDRARSGAGKVLLIIAIIFAIGMISVLAKGIMQHVDGDTFTINSDKTDSSEECGDEQAQKAMRRAGVKVPVKCKNKNANQSTNTNK
jgi:hypothetical protein